MKLNDTLINMGKVFEDNQNKYVDLGFELMKFKADNNYASNDIISYLKGETKICLNFYELLPLIDKYGYELVLKHFKRLFVKEEGEKENA